LQGKTSTTAAAPATVPAHFPVQRETYDNVDEDDAPPPALPRTYEQWKSDKILID
jgi:hypothetical protein